MICTDMHHVEEGFTLITTVYCHQEQKISDMIKMKVRLPETGTTYIIPSVQAGDEGRYFCKVSNSLGIEEAFADLKVLSESLHLLCSGSLSVYHP